MLKSNKPYILNFVISCVHVTQYQTLYLSVFNYTGQHPFWCLKYYTRFRVYLAC
jgi:hypothetical protein